MNRLGYRILGSIALLMVFVLLAGCAKDVEIQLAAKQTYIGPRLADSIKVRLTDSYGFDYKVNLSCTFTNVGGPGRVNVLATVTQGDKSWDRRALLLQTEVGQPMSTKFVFDEPTFDFRQILAPLVSLVVPSPWGGIASAVLGEQSEVGIRGSCQVYPTAADMKTRLDCIVSNVGEGSGTVTIRGSSNDIGQARKIDIGPEEQKIVPFLFQVESEDELFGCQVD